MDDISAVCAKMEKKRNFLSMRTDLCNQDILELAHDLFGGTVSRPVTDGMISEVAQLLGTSLDIDYDYFLRTYGYAMWIGNKVYGISPVDNAELGSYNFSTQEITRELAAKSAGKKIRKTYGDYLVLSEDSLGGYYIHSATSHSGCRYFYISREDEWVVNQMWKSFTQMLASFVDK